MSQEQIFNKTKLFTLFWSWKLRRCPLQGGEMSVDLLGTWKYSTSSSGWQWQRCSLYNYPLNCFHVLYVSLWCITCHNKWRCVPNPCKRGLVAWNTISPCTSRMWHELKVTVSHILWTEVRLARSGKLGNDSDGASKIMQAMHVKRWQEIASWNVS